MCISMIDIIYKYKLKRNESSLKQGDIFRNLPIITNDILVESKIGRDSLENEAELLQSRVIGEGEAIFIETFLKPTYGILASQDCEIRPKYNLVFYPLYHTKPIKSRNTSYVEFSKKNIRDTTRICYLPEIKISENKTAGPFYIDFQNPFSIPYKIVKNNFNNCWMARVIEPARQVIIGKLAHFYTRTPIDEIIFLNNEEITKLVQEKWKKNNFINKYKSKSNFSVDFENFISEISDIKKILNLIGRKSDYSDIKLIDLHLISKLHRKFIDFNFGNESHNLIKLCKKLVEEKSDEPLLEFKIILDFFKNKDLVKGFFEFLNENNYREITDNLKLGSIINKKLINRKIINKKIKKIELIHLGKKASTALDSLIYDKYLIKKYNKLYQILK